MPESLSVGETLGFEKEFFFFFFFFFLSHVYVSLSTLRFSTLFHNDSAAHQDHCRRCRIRTRDLCTDEPPHLPFFMGVERGITGCKEGS